MNVHHSEYVLGALAVPILFILPGKNSYFSFTTSIFAFATITFLMLVWAIFSHFRYLRTWQRYKPYVVKQR